MAKATLEFDANGQVDRVIDRDGNEVQRQVQGPTDDEFGVPSAIVSFGHHDQRCCWVWAGGRWYCMPC